MNKKIKTLIIFPVLIGILTISVYMAHDKNIHTLSLNSEDDIFLKKDIVENSYIENKINIQSPDNYQGVEGKRWKNNELQDSHEINSLVSWVNKIDDVVSSKTLDADSKIKKIFNWLNEKNTPNEIRIKLYRALVQLKPIDFIEEIFSFIEKENNLDIKLAGMEALALTGKQLITLGYAEGQYIISLLKGAGQQTQEAEIRQKLHSLVAYMENVLAGNTNGVMNIEYLTGKDAYVWDLSAKLEGRENISDGLTRLLDDVSILVDQDEALLNEEYSKLNLAYLNYFANGFSGDVPDRREMDYFFEKIKPRKIETLTEDAVLRYRIWFTAYSYAGERDSSDYNDFIMNELRVTRSPVAALVFIENGVNVIDQLDSSTREKLVSLLEEDGVAIQGRLSEDVAEALGFLIQ